MIQEACPGRPPAVLRVITQLISPIRKKLIRVVPRLIRVVPSPGEMIIGVLVSNLRCKPKVEEDGELKRFSPFPVSIS